MSPNEVPDGLELIGADEQSIDLRERATAGPLVVYFYPGDFTPVCTAQACGFRDDFDSFRELGVEVIGVSTDSAARHRKFAKKFSLPFTLTSDPGRRVSKRLGIGRVLGVFPPRVTLVIDRDGVIRERFSALWRGRWHSRRALEAARSLVSRDAEDRPGSTA